MSPDEIRSRLCSLGWLSHGEVPLSRRLEYRPDQETSYIHAGNRRLRDRILADMLEGVAKARPLPTIITADGDDIPISHVDRFGLPLRTVLSLSTGLMRSDPYYDDEYIIRFYRDFYRDLYQPPPFRPGQFFAYQVSLGEEIYDAVQAHLPPVANVLDFGCGMGGATIAFKMRGHRAVGCDYGKSYLDFGRKVGLNLVEGGVEAVRHLAPFDLIVLSQVVEHQIDPVGYLAGIRSLLAENGLIYIMVPGIFCIKYHYNSDIMRYLQNAHVWHFTAATLGAVVAQSGFSVVACDEVIRCLAKRTTIPLTPDTARIEPRTSRSIIDELRHLEKLMGFPGVVRTGIEVARRLKEKLAR